jgi:histidinol phosphatase-like enzyme (inositol monophosphatase family)
LPANAPPEGPFADFQSTCPGRAGITAAELDAALAVAHRACDAARAEILPRYGRVAIETKTDGSPVTEADRESERAIRRVISAAFPEDALFGEELGGRPGRDAHREWVIDPIDGTIAFSRGIPLFTTLVALLVEGEPVVGVIDLPAVGDRISGRRGGGVRRGGEHGGPTGPAVGVSNGPTLHDALVCHGDLFCFELAGLRAAYDAMSHAIPKLRGYTDGFGHLLVLTGAADAMVDCDLNPWDAAVTRILASEAGGVCRVRERNGGAKLDLLFGAPATVDAIAAIEAPSGSARG